MIDTLLDNDFYNFTMSQYAWQYHPDVKVRYNFVDRNKNEHSYACLLAIPQWNWLKSGVKKLQRLRFLPDELEYLLDTNLFSQGYVNFLRTMKLPEPKFHINRDTFEISVEYEGPWAAAVFLETPLLALITEARGKLQRQTFGQPNLKSYPFQDTLKDLTNNPGVKLIEFSK